LIVTAGMRRIHLVQDKGPVEVGVEYNTDCNCLMRMIHLVQDKGPVEVGVE